MGQLGIVADPMATMTAASRPGGDRGRPVRNIMHEYSNETEQN